MPSKVLFGKKKFKYFIDYKDAKKMKPLCTFLSKMTAYRKDFDETKYIFFLIRDNELIEKHNENAIKKEFNSNPVYILIPESQIKIL